jgi:hypothetical protein
MKRTFSNTRRIIASVLVVVAAAGCSSSPDSSVAVAATPADSGLLPTDNGFTFANFGSSVTKEFFNTEDLVTMFGSAACVDGKESPCELTTQAAAWARMVNEARASGHCEGLAVQAAARFDGKATPATKELQNAGDVTHGIMRAFATQFLPEVQDATNEWAKKSLSEIVNELVSTMKTGKVEYSLGLYTPTGGHAVLPYAIEFPSKDLAVIKVYDSNWPGQERFVVIDLAAKKWFFSFNGKDPQKDECAWTGGAGDIDMTPMTARTSATCPFCGDKATVTKSVLLIRSTGVEWSVKTKNGTFSPSTVTAVEGTNSRSLRSASCGETVSIPEFVLTTDSADFELTLPETASAYVSNGKSVVQIQTKGKKARQPIKFTQTSVQSDDPGTTVTLAANNLATQVTADTTIINFTDTEIVVDATIGTETKTVTADVTTPQIIVSTDTGAVVTTSNNVDLKKTEVVVTPDLTPPPTKGELPPAEVREAAAAVASTTTTVAATSTTAVTNEATSQEKPTAVPTAKQIDAVPDAPAGTPMTTKKSYTEGDKVSFTQPGFEPNSWVQVVVSPPTKILQTVQASSTGKVAVNTKMPTNVVGASSLRRPRATSTSPIFLCLISQARGNYDSGDCVKVVLSGGTITTVAGSTTTTIAATTTTVAATTTTVAATTTTVAATTTTTTVPTKTLTVFGYGGGSAPSGTITMNPSVGATKTCTSLMTDCVGTFQVGATVAITVAVTSTGYYITWTPESFVEYNPGAIAAPAACPQVAESGPQPVGAEILPTGPGSLLCTFTMVASNTRFSYWVSGAAG